MQIRGHLGVPLQLRPLRPSHRTRCSRDRPPRQVREEGMAALRAIFQRNGTLVPDPLQFHFTRWAANPWARGKIPAQVLGCMGGRRVS